MGGFVKAILMRRYCRWPMRRLALMCGLWLSVSTLVWGAPSPAAATQSGGNYFSAL